jgi:alcohol dehydrogenase (cytochrome c)
MGPGIARRVPNLTDAQIKTTVLEGLPARGMPANNIGEAEMPPLVLFLRGLRPRRSAGFEEYPLKAVLTDGQTIDGTVISEGFDEAALRTADRRIHLLRKVEGARFREVTSQSDWPSYNGDTGGNRYTTLRQIDKSNVSQVSLRWMFTLPNVAALQMTPLVVDGVMYATAGNECYALDAGTGRQIWHYQRPRPAD